MPHAQRLRMCYFGTYRQEYSRNQIMIDGLKRAGVDVVECFEPFWCGIEYGPCPMVCRKNTIMSVQPPWMELLIMERN